MTELVGAGSLSEGYTLSGLPDFSITRIGESRSLSTGRQWSVSQLS